MATKYTPEEIAELNARIAANPRLMQALRESSRIIQTAGFRSPARAEQERIIREERARMGIADDPHDYSLDPHTGQFQQSNYLTRNWEWIAPSVFAGGAAAPYVLPGAGPASAASQAAGAPAATEAAIFGSPAAQASAATAAGAGGAEAVRRAGDVASNVGERAVESVGDRALNAALTALAGLPAALGNRGPSDEERGYSAQATRLLGQQEQRNQFQNPLYEAVTRMAHGLLPTMGNGGKPYPINSLSDVSVPGLEDLLRTAQRRT
jgi:hypothetical protein